MKMYNCLPETSCDDEDEAGAEVGHGGSDRRRRLLDPQQHQLLERGCPDGELNEYTQSINQSICWSVSQSISVYFMKFWL